MERLEEGVEESGSQVIVLLARNPYLLWEARCSWANVAG